jgi:AGCS family alanine or glycine:cation symporter
MEAETFSIAKLIGEFGSFLWGWPMIIALLGTHLYLTIYLKFPQRKIFTAIRMSFKKDKGAEGDVSQFGALTTSLAATIGTGNIIGVATAVALGGPGAVLWCWLTGVFGIATKYGEGLLAVKYRIKNVKGEMLGGPMYALERGLKMKWLAVLFSLFTVLAAFGIGNMVQANSISMLLNETWHIPTYVTGIFIAVGVAGVIFFGIKGISNVCIALVPFMAIFYILGCLYILVVNGQYLGETFALIIHDAFTPRAAGGGFVGASVLMAARFGIARGLFSNESGLGSAPIAAAAAKTRNPVRQALVSSTGTFWDTVIICALTGLVLVSSVIAHPDIDSTAGGALTKAAFDKIPLVGPWILAIGIMTFAFSTILGWYFYSEKALEYLSGRKWFTVYRIFYVGLAFVGSTAGLALVWDISDCMNALMAVPNLVSLLLLSKVLLKDTNKYLWGNRLDEIDTEMDKL